MRCSSRTASEAKLPPYGSLRTSQITSVSSKTRFAPGIQSTRKSLNCFDWPNCSLLICTTSSRKISLPYFPSFPPSYPNSIPQSLRGNQIKTHLGTPSTGNSGDNRHRHHFQSFAIGGKMFQSGWNHPNLKPPYKLSLLLVL